MNRGVFPSIYQNGHYQIVFAKANLSIFYPPPYTRCICDYGKANHEAINNNIANFDWEKAFSNINVHTQVELFNEILTNIFMNVVPNRLITVDDRDPLWVTENLRKYWKTKVNCINDRKDRDYEKLLDVTNNTTAEFLNNKKNYFDNSAEKLCDPKLNRKAYLSIPKSFANWRKVSVTPRLFINDNFVTNSDELFSD